MVARKSAYLAIGIDSEGFKDVPGDLDRPGQEDQVLLKICNELATRGVANIIFVCVDGLKGLPEAIESVWTFGPVRRGLSTDVPDDRTDRPYPQQLPALNTRSSRRVHLEESPVRRPVFDSIAVPVSFAFARHRFSSAPSSWLPAPATRDDDAGPLRKDRIGLTSPPGWPLAGHAQDGGSGDQRAKP